MTVILDFVRENWHSGNIEHADFGWGDRPENRRFLIITIKGGRTKSCVTNNKISAEEWIKGWGDYEIF